MAYEWIKAPLALRYVSGGTTDHSAMMRICERAHSGLIAAKADLVIAGEQRERDYLLGKGFWWAEGNAALEQDWLAGDFSTCIDQKIRVQAFGVSFDFTALSDLVPADRQAEAIRRISATGSDEWISAAALFAKLQSSDSTPRTEEMIVQACQLGQIAARALRAQGLFRDRTELNWAAREWDVPLWFWRDFAKPEFFQDWRLNKAHGQGQRDGHYLHITLQGLHFHRSGLPNLGVEEIDSDAQSEGRSNAGRKPTYDWSAATATIWGQIYRGELIPENQGAIEKAFQILLTRGNKEPSESTVCPYAQPIWRQIRKA